MQLNSQKWTIGVNDRYTALTSLFFNKGYVRGLCVPSYWSFSLNMFSSFLPSALNFLIPSLSFSVDISSSLSIHLNTCSFISSLFMSIDAAEKISTILMINYIMIKGIGYGMANYSIHTQQKNLINADRILSFIWPSGSTLENKSLYGTAGIPIGPNNLPVCQSSKYVVPEIYILKLRHNIFTRLT